MLNNFYAADPGLLLNSFINLKNTTEANVCAQSVYEALFHAKLGFRTSAVLNYSNGAVYG